MSLFNFFKKKKPESQMGNKPNTPSKGSSRYKNKLEDKVISQGQVDPYFKTKKTIETEINDYARNSGEIKLPKIEFKREGNETSVNFSMGSDANLYKVIDAVVKSIGEMRIDNGLGEGRVALYGKNMRIYLSSLLGTSITFNKKGNLTSQEINAIIQSYKLGNSIKGKKSPEQRLSELGVTVYNFNNKHDWDSLAGYDNIKQEIKDTILLPLKHPQVYDNMVKKTRKYYENIRPKAVLFEGPPGTGKTTTARILAGESKIPLVYVPVESIMTKWYGESQKNLSGIFDACYDLGNSLIFLDEIDSLATSRAKDLHEETRRTLSVLLRKIDGFEENNKTILIGATNRSQDLDPALLSRFDVSVNFGLPNAKERAAIFKNYAKHLKENDLKTLADRSENYSGRNIKDICKHSERRLVSKTIRHGTKQESPCVDDYILSIKRNS